MTDSYHRATRVGLAVCGVLVGGFWLSSVAPPDQFVAVSDSSHPGVPAGDTVDSTTIINQSITAKDIASNTITIDNLDTTLQTRLNQSATRVTTAAPPRIADTSAISAGLTQALGLVGDLDEVVGGVVDQLGLPLRIDSLGITDGTIALGDLAGDTIAALEGGIGTVTSASIANGTILGEDISIGAITADLVTDGTITAIDIADGAVNTLLLADGAVTGGKIADFTINTTDIAADAVTNGLLAAGSVTSAKIVDGSITGIDVADGSIGLLDIANNAVSAAHIVDGSLTTADIAGNSITEGLIADGTIASTDIADGAIATADIMTGAITTVLLALDSVTGSAILNGTIAAADISVDAITSALILDGAVTGLDIGNASISTADIAASAITAGLIADATITTADIANNAIAGALIADNAITSAKIFDGTIGSGDIATGAITNGLLAGGAVHASNLSTSANKKTVSVQIGNIASILSDFERPIFVAPTSGTITKVTFTDALGINTGLTKGTISVERKTAAAATVASASLNTISLSAFTPYSPSLVGGQTFNAGDVYSFFYDTGLVGVTFTGFLITIEYTATD